ncbi:MAG: hypothetical protein LBU29_01530, partial [Endomicrobium sp.]|nr:hypothetical protein [Endomicrobium sp.]
MMKKKFIQVGSFLVGFVMVPLLATVPCAGVFKEPKALLDVKEEAVADSEKKSILELLKAGHDAGAVVVAKVDNVPIFAQELLPFVNAMISRGPTSDEQGRREIFLQYLRHKIIECTLVCEAKRQGYTAKPKEIQVKFVEILKQFGTESMLEKRTGMTVVRFKEELGNSIVRKKLIDRLVDSRMKKVTESDTRSFYDRVIIKLNGGKVDLSSDDAEAVDIIVDLFKQKFDERVKFGQIFVS